MLKKSLFIGASLLALSCQMLDTKTTAIQGITADTPYINSYLSGDMLYPESGWKLYATDQLETYSYTSHESLEMHFPNESNISTAPIGSYEIALSILKRYENYKLDAPREITIDCIHCEQEGIRYFDGSDTHYYHEAYFPAASPGDSKWENLIEELRATALLKETN